MKKILCGFTAISFIVILVVSMTAIFNVYRTEVAASILDKIDIDIVSVSNEKIEIEIKNSSNKQFSTSGYFELKKKKNGKWEKVRFKSSAMFVKTISVQPNSSKIRTIKWKDYFWRNLTEGKYKIEFIKSKKFEITEDNTIEKSLQCNQDKWITEGDKMILFQGNSAIQHLTMNGLWFKMAWIAKITMWLCF